MERINEEDNPNLTTKGVYDYALIKRALNGEQKAFAELMHRYKESMYFTMLKMTANKDDADDLTIEAFGKAFKNLHKYSPQFAFSTWLFRIGTNNAIDFIRGKKIKYPVSIDTRESDFEDGPRSINIKSTGLDPEEEFIKKQKIENIRMLVDNLKPRYKEMIELFYFQELSHEEIMQKLNLNRGKVKITLNRAREFLFQALKRSEKDQIEIILKYFPGLSQTQILQFRQLYKSYEFWNEQINVISRKDISHIYEKHVLHSLSIGKIIQFKKGTQIMDIGTGGGFPGIPLAILFPDCHFTLVDSVAKKIKVVNEVIKSLDIKNAEGLIGRAEEINHKFDFVVSRAVTDFQAIHGWVQNKILKKSTNDLKNGIICLKGGDLKKEFGKYFRRSKFYDLKDFFEEEFFETKKIAFCAVAS